MHRQKIFHEVLAHPAVGAADMAEQSRVPLPAAADRQKSRVMGSQTDYSDIRLLVPQVIVPVSNTPRPLTVHQLTEQAENWHSRMERGRNGRECKFQNKAH